MQKILKMSLFIVALSYNVIEAMASSKETDTSKETVIFLIDRFFDAIRSGNVAAVQSCCDEGADVNWSCEWGTIPALIEAVRHNHYDVVRLLIDKGADVNSYTRGERFFNFQENRFESKVGNPVFIEAMIVSECEKNPHRNEVVELLIDKGADVNVQNICGTTGLMIAVVRYEDKMVKKLLAQGANQHIEGSLYFKECNTPYKMAKYTNKKDEEILAHWFEHKMNLDKVPTMRENIEKINRIIALFDEQNNTK